MKIIRVSNLLFLIILTLFVSSCENKDDSENQENWQYLVSYEKEKDIDIKASEALFALLAIRNPEANELINAIKYDVVVYSISYKTKYKGEEIIASGLISVPVYKGEFPILSFQNGTNTSHLAAPTANLNNLLFYTIQSMASNGYVVLMPDYIGFGTTIDILHPYVQKQTSNSAVIDLMYAAQEFLLLPEILAEDNKSAYLMGYSQGGWATLAALSEIEERHSDLNIKATSCGAGPFDLLNISNFILDQATFPSPLYMPYYIHSHNSYGNIDYPLTQIFKEPYAGEIPELFNGSKTNDEVNAELTEEVNSLMTEDFVLNFDDGAQYEDLRTDLKQNSVSAWSPSSFINFYHGTEDINVPPSESKNIFDDFVALGAESKVQYFELDGLDHLTGAEPWGIKTMIWFNSLEYGK